jgi:hypothetical protein
MDDFQFPSTRGASAELIEFLSRKPSPKEVFDYYISDKHQKRLDNLLDLNGEGEITESQERELDEWMKFDHISIMLKIRAAKLSKQNA